MNGLRERLYPNGFRPMRYGTPLFVEANLNPHFLPFRGIVFSILVHASLLTALIVIPIVAAPDERPDLSEAIILDADDLKNALYLPLLGSAPPPKPRVEEEKAQTPPAKEGLSYPGPQPILSQFPVPTNHTQTILQPALKNPVTLDGLSLPNVVRLPPPAVDRKLAVPDATTPQLQPPPMLSAQRDVNMAAPAQALAPPRVENRLYVPDALASVARPAAPVPTAQLDPALSGPARPLNAPRVDSRLNVPDQAAAAIARPSTPVAMAVDPALSGPSRPLAAPLVESRFKLPDAAEPIARPTLPVQVGAPTLGMSGPSRPLNAPRVESTMRVPDATTPQGQPTRATAAAPVNVPLTGPARPLSAPRVESRISVPDATTTQAQPTRTIQSAPMDASLAGTGPARPLAAPVAESKLRVADSPVTPVARPGTATVAPKLDASLNGPSKPLAAPIAESRLKVPEAIAAPTARSSTAAALPTDTAVTNAPPLVALSPTPARRDQTVVVPPGEARGRFAISPQPNLNSPGTEPGVRGGSSSTNSVAGVVNSGSSSSASNTRTGNNTSTTPGAGRDAFPGITILGGDTGPSITTVTPSSTTGSIKTPPPPLQTSYDLKIVASGGSGGGLPDFGVFTNEQVHTVYLDSRDTIADDLVWWTVAFGVRQTDATSADDRVTSVAGRQEIVLPFPIQKAKPSIPAELVRKYSDRLVIAYAIVNAEGKIEQLSIKQSPDPTLNELVLSSLRKWTFSPARRNGEVIPAKMLLGIPVRTY